MKTVEEILIKNYDKIRQEIPYSSTSVIWKTAAIKAMEEYAQEVAKNLHKPPVSGMFPLSKIKILLDALDDIKNWDDNLEDEWEDPGYRARAALEKWIESL